MWNSAIAGSEAVVSVAGGAFDVDEAEGKDASPDGEGEAEANDAEAEDTAAFDFDVVREGEGEDAAADDVGEADADDLEVEREDEEEDAAGEDATAVDLEVDSVNTPGVAAGAFEDAAADDVGEADAAGEDAATLDLEVEVDELGEVDEDCLLPFKGREWRMVKTLIQCIVKWVRISCYACVHMIKRLPSTE